MNGLSGITEDSNSERTATERESFVLLIAAHQTRLRAFIRCLLIGSPDVDDVLQETNRVLWQKCETFVSGSDFWAWASQVARYEVLAYQNRRNRERGLVDSELVQQLAHIAAAELEDADHRLQMLEECLKELPSASRQLIELRYFSEQSIPLISAAVNRPEGSIRQTLYRIREALRECVARKLRGEQQQRAFS